MKALFITTETNECDNHVAAWDSFNEAALRFRYGHNKIRLDGQMLEYAREHEPEIIFYIGAVRGLGVPKPEHLRMLRDTAPIINLVSDAADSPWWRVLNEYRDKEVFDLQVAIDGHSEAPVDLYTLTPVDPEPFNKERFRAYDCGFSGTMGRSGPRLDLLRHLPEVTVRQREAKDGYKDHAEFLLSCKMLLNTSWTGSGRAHHMKGRVIEAGLAGCALLEHVDSPILGWVPPGYFYSYASARDVKLTLDHEETTHRAELLEKHIRQNYSPKQIYGEILDRVGYSI